MVDVKQNWLRLVVFILLLVGSIYLVYLQVSMDQRPTRLEGSLLNVFQFFLSIGFTWILSQVVFETSYKASQKKLAIAAFRRIKEIERNIKRTQVYVNSAKQSDRKASECLEVVDFSLINAKDTIRSSISDWEDVIGEELEVAEKIESLSTEKLEMSLNEEVQKNKDDNESRRDSIDEEIKNLKRKLPSTMRRTITVYGRKEEKIEAVYNLGRTMLEDGCLELDGFWSQDGEFMITPSRLSIGDTIYVARGMAGNRIGSIMAYDQDQNTFGVITNKSGGAYDTFSEAMETVFERRLIPKALGGEPLIAELIEISPLDPKTERQHFKVRVTRKLRKRVIDQNPQLKDYNKKIQPTPDGAR